MSRRWALLLAAMLGVPGCAAARMEVPAALGASPDWPVRPRSRWLPDSPLRVGPYEAHRIDRQGVRQRGGVVDVLTGKTEQQQRYGFVLRDTAGADRWAVRCDNRDVERGVRLGSVQVQLDDRTSLECALHPPDDPAPAWTLRMRGGEGAPRGRLSRGAEAYDVEGRNPPGPQTDCCEPLGYLFSREGRAVASVERGGWGRVRMAPGSGDESLLAAAAVALLLQSRLIKD